MIDKILIGIIIYCLIAIAVTLIRRLLINEQEAKTKEKGGRIISDSGYNDDEII